MTKRFDILKELEKAGLKEVDEASKKAFEAIENALNDGVEKLVKGAMSEEASKNISENAERMKNLLKEMNIDDKTFENVSERLEAIEKKIIEYNSMMKKTNKTEQNDVEKSLEDAFKGYISTDNKGRKSVDIKEAIKSSPTKNISVNINTKAAATITSGGAAMNVEIERGMTDYAAYRPWIFDVANVSTIGSPNFMYVQKKPKTSAAKAVQEGTAKPQMDFTIETVETSVKKIAVFTKVTTEALYDIPSLINELQTEIFRDIEIATQNDILNGTGTSGSLTGITDVMPGFTLSNAKTVVNPNMYDAIVAAVTQILSKSNNNYMPTTVVMNPIDIMTMQLTKDADGNYLMPIRINERDVFGLRVISDSKTTAGDFIVGDFRYANIRIYQDLMLSFGYDADDFTNNLVTARGERRLAAYIKSNNYDAFVKDSFATVITAITKAQG